MWQDMNQTVENISLQISFMLDRKVGEISGWIEQLYYDQVQWPIIIPRKTNVISILI